MGIEEQGWLGPQTLLAYEAFRYGYMLSTDNFIDGYCETYAHENQFFLGDTYDIKDALNIRSLLKRQEHCVRQVLCTELKSSTQNGRDKLKACGMEKTHNKDPVTGAQSHK